MLIRTISVRAQLLLGMATLVVACMGCGGARRAHAVHSAPTLNSYTYAVLRGRESNGIAIIRPAEAPAARDTPTHPIWIRLPAARKLSSVRPEVATAQPLARVGSLRVWLARNESGGICVMTFNPRHSPDPLHDHSLLVFCGTRQSIKEGAYVEEPAKTRGSYVIVGAVPDGIDEVVARLVDDRRIVVPVSHNAYHATLPGRVATVEPATQDPRLG